jgi:hypothetical protein
LTRTGANVLLATDSLLLVGTNCGIHCSTDHGVNWPVVQPGSITRGGGNYAVQGLAPGLYTIYAISSEGEQQQGRLVV